MYQVTVKGRTLEELKDAVNDINNELSSGVTPVNNTVRNLEHVAVPTMELAEDEEEVASPYTEAAPVAEVPAVIASPVAVAAAMEVANTSGVDAEGLPWDKRIHASSKGKVAKGTWRTKRGLDPALLAQVKAELVQAIHLEANPIAIPAAPISPATPAVAAIVPPVVASIGVIAAQTSSPIKWASSAYNSSIV